MPGKSNKTNGDGNKVTPMSSAGFWDIVSVVLVLYIVAGNHDEFLRPFMQYGIGFGIIELVNQTEHIGADGRHYLVVHGDLFDGSLDWRRGWQC